MPIDAEGDPSRLRAKLNAGYLCGRHLGVVEDMERAVVGISHPHLLFIGSQADAMTRASMAGSRSLGVSLHLHAAEHLATGGVTHFEAKQIVHANVNPRGTAVDCERSDCAAKRADGTRNGIRDGIGDSHQRRTQPRKKHMPPIGAEDRVVRPGPGIDLGEFLAAGGIDHMPVSPLERRLIDRLPIGRDGHSVAAGLVALAPDYLLAGEVKAGEVVRGAKVETPVGGTGANSLGRFGILLIAQRGNGNPPKETMVVIDVENRNPNTPKMRIIAHSRCRDVKITAVGRGRGECGKTDKGENEQRRCQSHNLYTCMRSSVFVLEKNVAQRRRRAILLVECSSTYLAQHG